MNLPLHFASGFPVEGSLKGPENKKEPRRDELDELPALSLSSFHDSPRFRKVARVRFGRGYLINNIQCEISLDQSRQPETESKEGRSRLSERTQTVTFFPPFFLSLSWMADLVALKADLKSWERDFKLKNGREAKKEDIKAVPKIGQ